MPCWYYGKKDLKNTPSFKDGIDTATEIRYRREGARFIIDTGTKMGLRYDTCATGVVYFHRFYMFHSFREFHRYVTSACCLFLAGKVEETPKKCKDIIKTTRTMLTEAQFMVFGEDPKEELMTLERILLQTMKFDLQVEHPYAYLLKFAKIIKGDKGKIQKMVQMAWTFINDSLCTMLSLQWEPDIIAVALIYLAGRLTKYEITDWNNKQQGQRVKWYEFLVEDVTLELLEDICHQVLDLYSPAQQKKEDSPPPPPPPKPTQAQSASHTQTQPSVTQATKRIRSPSASRQGHTGQPSAPKSSKLDHSRPKSPSKRESRDKNPAVTASSGTKPPSGTQNTPGTAGPAPAQYTQQRDGYTTSNPYVDTQMYSSSFMSQEGAQSIQTLVGNTPASAAPTAPYSLYNPAVPPPLPTYSQPPPAVPPSQPPPQPPTTVPPHYTQQGYQAQAYQQGYQGGQSSYQAPQYPPVPPAQGQPQTAYSQQTSQSQYQNTAYGSQATHTQAPTQYGQYPPQYQQQYPNQQQQQQQQQQPPPPQQQQQYGSQYGNQQQQQQPYAQSGQPYASYSNQNYAQGQTQTPGYPPPHPQYPSQ